MQFIGRVFGVVSQVIAVLALLVQLVERPGEGAQKKEEVTTLYLEALAKLVAAGTFPAWVQAVFGQAEFIGWVIDLVIGLVNRMGFFDHEVSDAQ